MNIKKKINILLLIFTFFITFASAQTDAEKENLESAQKLIKAIQLGEDAPGVFYNTACYFALAGKTEDAFTYLEQSINRGYANTAHIKEDSDLVSLHNDARWQKMIEKSTAKEKEQKSAFYNQKTFWDNPALITPYQENISEDEKIAGLSKFWSEAKYNFANFDLIPDVNLDALYLEYLPKVRQTKSTLEYYKVLTEMCAKLRDGHTNVYAPKELTNEIYARPMLRSRLVEDKVLIIAVLDDSLKQNGIEFGQEIVEVDGIPVKEYAEKNVRPYQSASTQQDLKNRMFEYSLFSGSLNSPIKLTLRDAKGNILNKTISRVTPEERSKKMPQVQSFEFKMLLQNIAYVTLNSFENNQPAEMFAKNFAEISKADAIIFDVRNNGGGSSSVGWNIVSYLTDKPFQTSSWYTRQYRASFRAWERPQDIYGSQTSQPANGKNLYSKPVIVLTSSRTFSAAEDFVSAFSSINRGLIIGEPTGGSTGQPLFINLPGGGSARICTKRDKLPNGEDFVGKGIQPNKLVIPTIIDVRAEHDSVLEAALKELKK